MVSSTREALLLEAERLLRTCGYTAFSYADLAEKVQIRKASIHHHFPTKEDLGLAIVDGYLLEFGKALAQIEATEKNSIAKLRAFAQFFVCSLETRRLPLCGALAAELQSLPVSMQKRTRHFFEMHSDWLYRIIREGIRDGDFRADIDPQESSSLILSVLEGSSLINWVFDEQVSVNAPFEAALRSLVHKP